MPIERELKFHLGTRPPYRLARLARRRRKVASVYYDTRQQQLRRAGIALRLRRDGNVWLQTLKGVFAAHGGLSARSEWEMPVRGKALDLAAFPRDEIRMATGVDLTSLAHRLQPLFETRFTRHSGMVRLDGGGSAELAIDRGVIVAGRGRESISEVELELKSGESRALLRFAEQLALPLAYESKAERGYRLAAGLPRAPRKWSMPALDETIAPGAAFAALFLAALTQAGSNAAGVLRSSDPEYLHQMRVGLRRMRSALRAFDPILKKNAPLKRMLRSLMRALGSARDWDVLVQRLERGQVMARARRRRSIAHRRRSIAHRAARDLVASPRFNALLFRALRWIESRPWGESAQSLPRFGADSLDKLHRKALKCRSVETVQSRHALRIRLKRLRYACEFFSPCFPPAALEPYLRRLESLQDVLGELNDLAVGGTLLREIDARPPQQFARRERGLIAALNVAWAELRKQPPYWRRPE